MNKTNGLEAALKQIPIDEVSDISDHLVEIEVLMECRHPNVIGLLETFYHDSKLSVSICMCFYIFFGIVLVAVTDLAVLLKVCVHIVNFYSHIISYDIMLYIICNAKHGSQLVV